MNGFKIPKNKICVDYWEDEKEPHVRFLTHAHRNRIEGIGNVTDTIYMSSFSLWYLRNIFEEDVKENAAELDLDTQYELTDPDGEKFKVTLIDAEHCPGSVMFLFEGDFGQVLCTGDFRFSPNMLNHPSLKTLVESKTLDILNVDNRYIGEHCNFPPREDVIKDTVELIKSHPEHTVFICIGELGKIDLLKSIALQSEVKICITPKFMRVAKKLGISEYFTLEESRLMTHETDMLSLRQLDNLREKTGPTIALIMSSLYSTLSRYSKHNKNDYKRMGVHIMPYSDHSSHQELYDFINALRPYFLVPILKGTNSDPSKNYILSRSLKHIDDLVKNRTIPESIALLQRSHSSGGCVRTGNNSEPIVYDIADHVRSIGTKTRMLASNSENERLTPEECTSAKKAKTSNQEAGNVSNTDLYYWRNMGITGATFEIPAYKKFDQES